MHSNNVRATKDASAALSPSSRFSRKKNWRSKNEIPIKTDKPDENEAARSRETKHTTDRIMLQKWIPVDKKGILVCGAHDDASRFFSTYFWIYNDRRKKNFRDNFIRLQQGFQQNDARQAKTRQQAVFYSKDLLVHILKGTNYLFMWMTKRLGILGKT